MSGFYGLNNNLRYYEFELDSLDSNYSNGSGVAATDWPVFLIGGKTPLRNIAAIKILEVQIPFSWYVFCSENVTGSNTPSSPQWQLVETGGAQSGVIQYPIIAVGNYSGGAALATALQAALNGVSSSYTVSYSSVTQKMTFTTTKSGVTSFTFTFGLSTNAGNKNPRLYIGFPGGTTSSSGTTLVSPNVVLISGPNYLYVNSAKIGQLTNVYLPQNATNLGGGNGGPQMAKIPVNVISSNVIYWQDPDPEKWFDLDNLDTLSQIDFYLTLGNTTSQLPLQLNGLSFSIKLGVLTNEMVHNDIGSGVAHEDRIIKRIRPF
jgi:hypothetical protein